MGKTTKILLGLSLAGLLLGTVFATGLVNAENVVALYTALPLGAVFFGLFLISLMLEKEGALFDLEQQALLDSARQNEHKDCCCSKTKQEAEMVPAGAK